MSKFCRYFFILAMLVFFLPMSISAQHFDQVMSSEALRPFWSIYGIGASSFTLLNNSYLETDIGSTQSNPAFLINVKRPKGSFSGISITPKNLTTLADGGKDYSASTTKYNVSYIGFAYPFPVYQGSFVMAASYSPAAYYYSSSYTKGTTGAAYYDEDGNAHIVDTDLEYDINESGTLNVFRFAGATEFMKNFNLGLSFNFYSGQRNYESTEIGVDVNDELDFNSIIYQENIKPSYSGFNMDFGMCYQSENYKIGLRLSTPLKLKVHEVSELTETYSYDTVDSIFPNSYDFKYRTRYPLEIAPNFAIKVGKISLGMDFIFHNWQKIEVDLLDEMREVNRDLYWNLRNTTDIGAVLTIPFGNFVSTRLAYRLVPSPYAEYEPDEEYYHVMGAGIETILKESIIIGCSFQHGFGNLSNFYRYFETTTTQAYTENRCSISLAVLF
ncbi:MAG TPA: type IX secretion system membrane protein PorP/SprF [Candidatus Marinimicrobia bacterium]|nr:type IX secretion system membrane protein PorP/SprF [Candidatus Neomarinimicrobiota bacterium]HQE94947.1 type IX secretion system membrane protein PorP/SprF [Candidatus Neomarinimicrobiota bacterium]HQH55769.1 type IX secretion system membrane protein PorP/SprF [Candidatus Neomarinimicrobiota bacterium]HQK10488.1 type IX secretion system membrane protein PorP/SprF [Candidatus Neomarinimicrobiota bacterium]